jgi:hypothetical protein
MQIRVKITFDSAGQATIRLPEGKGQKVEAGKAAAFTDALARKMGNIKERHIGDHTHEHGEFVDGHTHDTVEDGG